MHSLYSTEISRHVAIFLSQTAWWVSLISSMRRDMEWKGRSRLFKLIKIRTNRKPVCDFLLTVNSNLSRISHRFGDITTKRSELCVFFAILLTPFLFKTLATGVHVEPRTWKLVEKIELGLPDSGSRVILRLLVLTHCQRVTDRRADTSAVDKSRCIIAERHKNRDEICDYMKPMIGLIAALSK